MNKTLYASLLTENPYDADMLDAWLDERAASMDTIELPDEIASARQDNRRLEEVVGEYDGDIAPEVAENAFFDYLVPVERLFKQ